MLVRNQHHLYICIGDLRLEPHRVNDYFITRIEIDRKKEFSLYEEQIRGV